MSNMGYCAFRNTLGDLQDCRDRLFDECSDEEHRARINLVKTCYGILEDLGVVAGGLNDATESAEDLPCDERETALAPKDT